MKNKKCSHKWEGLLFAHAGGKKVYWCTFCGTIRLWKNDGWFYKRPLDYTDAPDACKPVKTGKEYYVEQVDAVTIRLTEAL